MRRVVLGVFASFVFLGGPANAGAGQYPERGARVWYSSNCCYLKVARDDTAVRYARVQRRYRPIRVRYDWRYRVNYPWPYYGPHHSTYYPYRRGTPYANYVPPPDCRLVRVTDGAGGWIWARRAGCL